MDLSYGAENDAKLVRNPYGIKIEFNNSPDIVNGLIACGIDPKDFSVCHNFYPQRYTGMKWEKFVQKNAELKICFQTCSYRCLHFFYRKEYTWCLECSLWIAYS